jgi:hypothetical protein
MSRLLLLGSALLVLLFSAQAFAQATAEAAMGNSAAGNAAAKTGSALGSTLGKAFDKSAQKLSNATQAPAQPAATSASAPAPANNAANEGTAPQPTVPPDAAIVQFSVNDVGTRCPAPKDWRESDTAAPTTNNLTVCSPHASAKPFPKTKYKPVVDIKF